MHYEFRFFVYEKSRCRDLQVEENRKCFSIIYSASKHRDTRQREFDLAEPRREIQL